MTDTSPGPIAVGLIMGSKNDWETMQHSAEALDELQISYEVQVVSAHRTPELLTSYASGAAARGIKVIIAGAGGAAHLPGMVAAMTPLPVVGVPVQSKSLNGLDSLLSIVQMPAGVPVATVAIGRAGAFNAGLLAGRILGVTDDVVRKMVQHHMDEQRDAVLEMPDPRDIP